MRVHIYIYMYIYIIRALCRSWSWRTKTYTNPHIIQSVPTSTRMGFSNNLKLGM